MSKKQIVDLIEKGEAEQLECKPSLSDLKRIVEVVCSFANKKGGTVLVGVSNQRNLPLRQRVMGIDIGAHTLEKTSNTIVDNMDPPIYPEIKVVSLFGKKLLSISVQESGDKPHNAYGRPFIRVGDTTRAMKRNEYEKLLLARKKIEFDTQIVEGASFEDIDEGKVKEFLKTRAIKLDVKVPQTSINDFLTKTIKVVKEIDCKLTPTNAALLFFGKNPQDFLPQSEVKVARFKGTTMIDFIDSSILKGTFYEILKDAEIFFKRNIRLANKIVEFKRVDIPEYPFEAVREAVVNAIAHRDYFRKGATVRLLIFDDRVEVDNPGGLLPGLDINNLEGVHETRNNLICSIFHETKDMEKYGTGIGKMKRWMREYGLDEPLFSQKGNFFKVTFYGPGDKILDLIADVPPERVTDLSHLNKRQIETLRVIVNERGVFTNKKYCDKFKVSRATAYRDLEQLVKEGFISVRGKYKDREYFSL